MSPRKIIVCIATSADGYIARPDGGVDWLHSYKPASDYGLTAFQKSIDAIIWGRRTFDEAVTRFGGKEEAFSDPKEKIKNYVITHRPGKQLPGLNFVQEPLGDFAQRLREEKGKNIWVMGGGEVIASLLDVGGIDEMIVHVIPSLIGEGIPLVAPGKRNANLKLLKTESWSDGVVKLHYQVLPAKTEKEHGQKGGTNGKPVRAKALKKSR